MIPSDFAGIFSRYFVIGFFVPVFFALIMVAHLVELSSTPGTYASASGGTQVVIIGGAALLGGLLLLGLNQQAIRVLAGYPLQRLITSLRGKLKPEGRLLRAITSPTVHYLKKWVALQKGVAAKDTAAAVKLNRYFPWQESEVAPTRLGNAIRSFESYPYKTFGLDGPPNWARVEALVTENEKEALAESLTTFAFWLNLGLLAPPAALYVVLGGVLPHSYGSPWSGVLLVFVTSVLGVLLGYGAYRASVDAAVRWGAVVRSAYDLHRLELYSQLGLKRPRTAAEERIIARSANRSASFGEALVGVVRNNP